MRQSYRVWQARIDDAEVFARCLLNGFANTSEAKISLEDYCVTFEGSWNRVDDSNLMARLESVFRLLNDDDRPTAHQCQSLSVGDLIQVNDDFYMVAGLGFKSVEVVSA